MRAALLSPLLMLLPMSVGLQGQQPLKLDCVQALFVAGTHNTHTYRIPAIVTAANGDLIAACDARRNNAGDLVHQRAIDIVFRRSEDGGATWTTQQTLDPITDGGCSDPSFVLDRSTKEIFCFYNYMAADKSSKEYRFKYQKSRDHGRTWDEPVDFTDQVAGPELKEAFKFVTSGRGIQTRDGTLIHNFVRVGHGATLFASRDHGATWATIGEVRPADESKVVELGDQTLLVNSRWQAGERYDHRSVDGGKSWTSTKFALPDPRCNASIVQYTCVRDGFAQDRLLFCNAASNTGRENLTMRISYDQGATWSAGTVIDAGPAAYSEITILLDGSIGVLYEPGYKEVRFVRFTLESLTAGQDRLERPYVSVP
jgi:BNR repeat-like domain